MCHVIGVLGVFLCLKFFVDYGVAFILNDLLENGYNSSRFKQIWTKNERNQKENVVLKMEIMR